MKTFQISVGAWCVQVFGETVAKNVKTRCARFIEEAVELVQALGLSDKDIRAVVDYVLDRPVGDPFQEVGGTMVTLAALCEATDISMSNAAWTEQGRCMRPEVIAKIRAKQASKVNPDAALPGTGERHCGTCGLPATEFPCGHPCRQDTISPALGWAALAAGGLGGFGCMPVDFLGDEPEDVPAFHLSSDRGAAVSDSYYYSKDFTNCPKGAKVILLGAGGVATLGSYDGDPFWVGWAALPKDPK